MMRIVKHWFTKLYTLEIYMKSGNMIMINRVTEYTVSANSDSVTKLSLTQVGGGRKLLVTTIDLDQIEAIVQVR